MYVSVKPIKNVDAAMAYARGNRKGHIGQAERHLVVTPINIDDAKCIRRNWCPAAPTIGTQLSDPMTKK